MALDNVFRGVPDRPWWATLLNPFWRTAPRQVRLALQQSLIIGNDWPDQVDSLSIRPGLALGVLRKRVWQYGPERIAELLRRRRVPVSSLSWAGGFTGAQGFSYQEAVDDGLLALEEAATIGAPLVVVVPGGQAGFTLRHARRLALDGVRRLVKKAEMCGLKLGLVADLGQRSSARSMLSDWEAANDFLEEVGSPCVGLVCSLSGLATVSERWRSYDAAGRRVFVVTTAVAPTEDGTPTVLPEQADAIMTRLIACGFRGTWEFATDGGPAPWWNARDAMLQCCPPADAALRRMSRRAGQRSSNRPEHR